MVSFFVLSNLPVLPRQTKTIKDLKAPNTNKQLKQDIRVLAHLLYDIFKEKEVNANVSHDQNLKSYTTKGKQS